MGQTEEFRQRLLPIEAWTSLLGEPISQNGPWGQGLYGPVKRGDCGVPWVTLMSSFARFEMEILHKTPSQEHQKARSKEKKKEGALPLLGQVGRDKAAAGSSLHPAQQGEREKPGEAPCR